MNTVDLEPLSNKALTESATTFNKWPPHASGHCPPRKVRAL